MDKECSSCGQKDHCQEIYAKLGQAKGPNIALKAIFAFVVPVAAFVLAAGLVQPWLKTKIDNPKLIIAAQVIIGLVFAFAILCIGKLLSRMLLSGSKSGPPENLFNKE